MSELEKCKHCDYKERGTYQFEDMNDPVCPPEDQNERDCCGVCLYDKPPHYDHDRCIFKCKGMSEFRLFKKWEMDSE